MKTVLRIARAELQYMFYSPVAWVILVVFAFQVGLMFTEEYEWLLRRQVMGDEIRGVTSRLFAYGIFAAGEHYLYLYFPLLTMGLMSREVNSGSIKLLYSSPIKSSRIILGKYISMLVYCLCLLLLLSVFIGFSIGTVKDLDMPAVLSGLLGIFLLGSAYSAIGLFMSCLISYQVAVAMGTLALLAVLNYIGSVGQDIAFVREITYWLSLSGRTRGMLRGLICSDDVIYFLMVIGMFLSFSILRLKSTKKHYPVLMSIGRYGGVLGVVVICGFLSSRPSLMGYHDTTATKGQTLSLGSQRVMSAIHKPITITTYVNLFDEKNNFDVLPKNLMIDMNRFRHYIRFKPDTRMNYIYYYDTIPGAPVPPDEAGMTLEERAKKRAYAYRMNLNRFLSPEEIKKEVDLSWEGNVLVRRLKVGDEKESFLRIFNDMMRFPEEAEITAAFKKLTGRAPVVAFLTGHGEPDIYGSRKRDYHAFAAAPYVRYALVNQGFELLSINLQESGDVPEGVTLLVVAGVQQPLSEEEIKAVNRYIAEGGNVLIAAEPGRTEEVSALVAPAGVRFLPGTVVQRQKNDMPHLIFAALENTVMAFPGNWRAMMYRGVKVALPGSAGLEYTESEWFASPLLKSGQEGSWIKQEKMNFMEDSLVLNTRIGEVEKSYPLALALTRSLEEGREQRMVVMGDADWLSDDALSMNREGILLGNSVFGRAMFSWLVYGEAPVNVGRPLPTDAEVWFDLDNMGWLHFAFLVVIPVLLIMTGVMIWSIRRRR